MPDQTKPLPPPRVFVETPRWCACRDCQRLVAKGFDPCIVWTPRILPPFDAAAVERVALVVETALREAARRYVNDDPAMPTHEAYEAERGRMVARAVLVAALGEGVVTG